MNAILMAALFLMVYFCEPGNAQVISSQNGEPQLVPRTSLSVPAAAGGTAVSGSSAQNPFFGGVPSGKPSSEVLQLSLQEAIDRGLQYNLGLLLSEQDMRAARGTRWRALSDLLPDIGGQASGTRHEVNLAALGFTSLPGTPEIIGPFNVLDARVSISQSIVNFKSIYNLRAESANRKAADYSYRDARDVVVLVCASLYLQAVAGASRIEAARAQVTTAEALYKQSVDLKKAGVVPGIDVLRSQVEFQAQQQRLIFFKNEFAKDKLTLARAIGLPIGQPFDLADRIPYNPIPPLTFEQALDQAYRSRSDFQVAVALVQAAESVKKAAQGEGLPSVEFDGDYGDIGQKPETMRPTFSVALELKVPIFQGGRVHGKVLEADALLRRRRAELEDLRSRIDYEVRTAFLDLKASEDQVQVAKSTLDLANEQLKQAQDRFSAGVVNSIEVVQAEDALAAADENYISSLYAFNVAKASLARAMGVAEAAKQFLGVAHP
jgi:outer membrane protein TolC